MANEPEPAEILGQVERKLAFLADIVSGHQEERLSLSGKGREGLYWILSDMEHQVEKSLTSL